MTDLNHGQRAHAKLSGSSAHRWTNCQGSVFYLDSLPPQDPTEASLEGTKAHELAEKMLDAFLGAQISGETTVVNTEGFSAEMQEGGLFYVNSLWKELLEEVITGKAYGLEERFTIDEHLEMSGIVDFWAVYIDDRGKRCGIVGDYKFGFHPVDAEDNPQLAFYAVALRKELQKAGKDLDLVYAAIIQPRAENKFQKVKFTAKQLDTWEKKFFKAARIILVDKTPKFKVGEWCSFCPAKAICKDYSKMMNAETALKLVDPEEVVLPVPEAMPKEALAKVVKYYDKLKDFMDACYTHVLADMRTGKKYEGLKLVEGKSRRKWKENEDAIITSLTKHKINVTEIKLKTLTSVEKELTKVYDKETAQEILSIHVDRTQSSLSIVDQSDPRPAVVSLLDKL